MSSNQNKAKKYIEYIPKLIANSKGLSKELNNRMKSNHLFSEFEYKASNQFNFFIKESEKRHLGSKYGTNIDYLLKISKKRGQKEAFKILNDNFYLDKELLTERKKMLKKSTNEVHDNIINLIQKIKGVKKTKNYWENSTNLKSNNYRKNVKPLSEDTLSYKDKIILEKKKKEINTVFNIEEKKLKTFFDKYKSYLTKVDNIIYEKTQNNLTSKLHNKIHFNVPKMQLLNYTKSFTHIKTKRDIDNENRINLKKLMQYSISKKDLNPSGEKNFCMTLPNKGRSENLDTKNTNSLVLQKALNEWSAFKNKFMKKNETINEKLGLDKIPSLKDYENLIKNNYNEERKRRRYLNEIISEKQKCYVKSKKELLISKIDENLKYLNNLENNLKKNKNIITI